MSLLLKIIKNLSTQIISIRRFGGLVSLAVRGAFRGGSLGGFLAAHRPFFIGLHVHRVTPTAGIQQHGFLHLFFVMFLSKIIL